MPAQLIRRPRVVLFERDARRAQQIANLLGPIAELVIAYHLDEAVLAFESQPEALLVCSGAHAPQARKVLPAVKMVTHSCGAYARDDVANLSVAGPSQLASAVMRLFRRRPI